MNPTLYLGILAILIIGFPVLIGYAISEKKNDIWLQFAWITMVVGFLLIVLSAFTG